MNDTLNSTAKELEFKTREKKTKDYSNQDLDSLHSLLSIPSMFHSLPHPPIAANLLQDFAILTSHGNEFEQAADVVRMTISAHVGFQKRGPGYDILSR